MSNVSIVGFALVAGSQRYLRKLLTCAAGFGSAQCLPSPTLEFAGSVNSDIANPPCLPLASATQSQRVSSPPRKRGSRACPWFEQGTGDGTLTLDSRFRGNDENALAKSRSISVGL